MNAYKDLIPHTLVFLDSPAADEIAVYLKKNMPSNAAYSGIFFLDTVADSKCLNNISGTTIVICGSGKYNPGRLEFHLKKNLSRPGSSLVVLGNAAKDTLCAKILLHPAAISIQGKQIEVKASLFSLSDPSFHIDQNSLIQWLGEINIPSNIVMLSHGNTPNSIYECINTRNVITLKPRETIYLEG